MSKIIKDKKSYNDLVDVLLTKDLIAIDTETEHFSQVKKHAFQLGLYGVGVYAKGVSGFILAELLDNRFQDVLNSARIVFHNFKFDGAVLMKAGYKFDNVAIHDTLVMSILHNENKSNHKLKNLAEGILKVKGAVRLKDVGEAPVKDGLGLFADDYDSLYEKWLNDLGLYCIDDCKYTYKLFNYFYPKLEADGLLNVYEKIELPILKITLSMELRGITVDLDYLEEIGKQMNREIMDLQIDIWKLAGKEFDINSPKQLSEILYQDRGYTLPKDFLTPKGVYSTNISALKYLSSEHKDDELIQKLFRYRELYKLYSTYIQGLSKSSISGVIYATFNQLGAKTGRFSSSSPNLQNLPSRSDKYDIRKAFIPRKGYKFVICDDSQVELRLAAFVSKDPLLTQAFKNGGDIHQETANIVGIGRKQAKSVNFGVLYGLSSMGLAKRLGISAEEAQNFENKYFEKFKSLGAFIQQSKNTIRRDGFVKSIFGRRRRFPEIKKFVLSKRKNFSNITRVERQATNSIIQGCLAGSMRVMERDKGFIEIEKLDNEVVWVWDGDTYRKGHCLFSGYKNKYTLFFDEGITIVCSADHKFLRLDGEWVSAKHIKKGMKFHISKNTFTYGELGLLHSILDTNYCATVKGVEKSKTNIAMYDILNISSGKFMVEGVITHNSAADLMKLQMIKLERALKGMDCHILIQIHDEVVIEVPENRADEILQIVQKTMEGTVKLGEIPIVANGFVSEYWKK